MRTLPFSLVALVALAGCDSGDGPTQAEVDDLKAQVAVLEANLAALQTDVGELGDGSLGETVAALDTTVTGLETRVTSLEATSFATESWVEGLGYGEGIAEVSGAVSLLDDELEATAAEVTANNEGIAANAARIDTHATAIAKNTDDIATNAAEIAANDALIASNDAAITALDDDLTDLVGDLGALEGTVADLGDDVTANGAAIAANTTDIADNATDIAVNASAIDSNADDLTELRGEVDDNTTAIDDNATAIGDAETAIDTLETDVSDQGDAIELLEAYSEVTWFKKRARNTTQSGTLTDRSLTFTKAEDDTDLWITWFDNLRVTGGSLSCQWEILVDGETCSVPGRMLVDMYQNSGSNLHIPTTLTQVCSETTTAGNIDAGSHTLSVRITGTVPGHSKGDCWTGWYDQQIMMAVKEVPR